MALFSYNSRFMVFMDRLADIFVLNLIWLIASVPIVSIGASTAAAFDVAMRMADGKEGESLWSSFWKAFKANAKQGSVLWGLQALALYALYIDAQIIAGSSEPPFLLIVASIVSFGFVVPLFLYAYPQIARYQNSVWGILTNSYRISFRYFGRTLLMLAVVVIEAAVFSWSSLMIFFGFLVGPMLIVYTIGSMSLRLFEAIEAQQGGSIPS